MSRRWRRRDSVRRTNGLRPRRSGYDHANEVVARGVRSNSAGDSRKFESRVGRVES